MEKQETSRYITVSILSADNPVQSQTHAGHQINHEPSGLVCISQIEWLSTIRRDRYNRNDDTQRIRNANCFQLPGNVVRIRMPAFTIWVIGNLKKMPPIRCDITQKNGLKSVI
jgi:hypothetical protein